MNYINILFGVEGKVTLVTGGRRGLGLRMAEALGKAGCQGGDCLAGCRV